MINYFFLRFVKKKVSLLTHTSQRHYTTDKKKDWKANNKILVLEMLFDKNAVTVGKIDRQNPIIHLHPTASKRKVLNKFKRFF